MKIQVKNFQSIKEQSLETTGLTVITGRSNAGKSALLRAVRGAFLGIPGNHYVRRGEDWTAVGIKGDDFLIKWRKAAKAKVGKETALEVNGKTHTKVGRDHDQLTHEVGIREIRTTHTRVVPQIAMQHNPIFLIGESDTTTAEILKKLSRVDVVTTAQKNALKDRRDKDSLAKVRQGDLEKVKEQLEPLKHIPALRALYQETDKTLVQAEEGRERAQALREKILRRRELNLIEVPSPPTVPEPSPIKGKVRRLMELQPREVPNTIEIPFPPQWGPKALGLVEIRGEEQSLKRSIEQTDTQIKELTAEIQRMEEEMKVCPTCERPFS